MNFELYKSVTYVYQRNIGRSQVKMLYYKNKMNEYENIL